MIFGPSGFLAGDQGLGCARNPVQYAEGFGRFSTVLDAASKDAEIMEDEPVIVGSGLSQEIEVVDEENTSHVWDDTFASYLAALI
ncbi:MAG: hypothetical protein DCO97_20660, partial [Marivita sp. XM-24bin2]